MGNRCEIRIQWYLSYIQPSTLVLNTPIPTISRPPDRQINLDYSPRTRFGFVLSAIKIRLYVRSMNRRMLLLLLYPFKSPLPHPLWTTDRLGEEQKVCWVGERDPENSINSTQKNTSVIQNENIGRTGGGWKHTRRIKIEPWRIFAISWKKPSTFVEESVFIQQYFVVV